MSTAMERIMRERGDCRCHHEPFMYSYYVGERRKAMPHFDANPDHPATYESIRDMLLREADEGPVFFKDMSYYVLHRLHDDEGFALGITNTFLIRDPVRAIASFYKLDPNLTSEEVGLRAQYQHHQWLTEKLGSPPAVVDAGDVQTDPAGMLRAYCHRVGLEFVPQALEWSGSRPKEWEHVAGWHTEVSGARGIRSDQVDSAAKAESLLAQEPRLRDLYEEHLPFYTALKSHRLAPEDGTAPWGV